MPGTERDTRLFGNTIPELGVSSSRRNFGPWEALGMTSVVLAAAGVPIAILNLRKGILERRRRSGNNSTQNSPKPQ